MDICIFSVWTNHLSFVDVVIQKVLTELQIDNDQVSRMHRLIMACAGCKCKHNSRFQAKWTWGKTKRFKICARMWVWQFCHNNNRWQQNCLGIQSVIHIFWVKSCREYQEEWRIPNPFYIIYIIILNAVACPLFILLIILFRKWRLKKWQYFCRNCFSANH